VGRGPSGWTAGDYATQSPLGRLPVSFLGSTDNASVFDPALSHVTCRPAVSAVDPGRTSRITSRETANIDGAPK